MNCLKCHSDNTSDSRFCKDCGAPLVPRDEGLVPPGMDLGKLTMNFAPGHIIADKYRIIQKLGEGGMGIVFEAEDIKLGRRVALKFLATELTSDPDSRERFNREALASSKLDHPNICTIYEIDEDEDHRVFMAMALCLGKTLKEKLKLGRLSIRETVEVARQVVQGLSRAHEEGIIHRDIKPGNIMETTRGEVKIVDFGLAKLTKDTEITQTAGFIGTLAYMSPEQIQGEPLDFRTDLWSFGVVLYEMLTGMHPFRGESPRAVIHSILNKFPLPPVELRTEIPNELERIVLKCLRKDRNERYQTTRGLLSDLAELKRTLEEESSTLPDLKKKPPIKRETEQRQATVMFIDITGFSAMLETLDSKEAASIVDRCVALFGLIEEKYGGKVDKITGFSFRAIFGIPTAIENAPDKAINAAIELRNQLADFSQREHLKTALHIRIGVNSGMVIAGRMGTDDQADYSVIGETVELASQLKDLSEIGTIYVGPATYENTKHEFEYRPLKSVFLKGKERPVRVFELLSVKEKVSRPGRSSERWISSAQVGREHELDKLQLHVLKAINGEGSIVNLIGEAGIGKSRLIAELKKNPILHKTTLLEGKALSIGKNLSFHPIIDILKNWADIQEEDSLPDSLQKLEKAILKISPESVENVFPFVATMMGMRLDGKSAERVKGIEGEALEKLILKSIREIIENASLRKTLVFVFEDLHWADLTSIKFLASICRMAEKNHVLFINIFRPDYGETSERLRQTILSRYSHICSEIYLKPLDDGQSETLINNLFKTSAFPAKVRELIRTRAEGNPFFIEEVVRSFIDDGVVEMKEGRFRVTPKIDSVVIPETVNDLLMARIDKLDDDTKSLLKIASVIGRNFIYKILIHVAQDIEDIDDKLDFLKEIELIIEGKAVGEVEYLFKHALVQEVTYKSILPSQRKEVHLKIASVIESIFPDRLHELYGMLAMHYSNGEDLEKAERYLIQAGQEALKSSASNEALHYYREALRIYLIKYGDAASPEKIAMLQKNIAIALFNRGHFTEAAEYFEKAMALYGEKKPKSSLASGWKVLLGVANFLLSLYLPGLKFRRIPTQKECEIIDLFQRKMVALSVTIPERMFIESFIFCKLLINYNLAKLENGLGMFTLYCVIFSYSGMSFRLSKKILYFVKDRINPNDVKPVLYFKFSRVIYDFLRGNWLQELNYDRDLIDRSLKIGEFFFTTNYLDMLCQINMERGNLVLARQLIEKVNEIGNVYDYDYAKNEHYFLKTLYLMKLREIPEVIKEAEQGIAFAQRGGYTPEFISINAFKSKAQILLGDLEGAEKTLQELDKMRSKENSYPIILNWYLTSRFLLDIRRLEKSTRSAHRREFAEKRKCALNSGKKALKNSHKIASERTEIYKLMGVYFWMIGKQKKAQTWWGRSIQEGIKLGASLELCRTYLEVGKRMKEKKSKYKELNKLNSQQLSELGQALFEQLNLPADYDRSNRYFKE